MLAPEQNSNDTELASSEDQIETSTTPQQSENPRELIFKVTITDIYNSTKNICDVSRQNVMLIEVNEIVKRGMGITNVPHPKDQLLVNFVLSPKDLEKNMIIEAIAKESLCLDASKTFFTINSYKILE